MEWIDGVPAGLIACILNGEEAGIAALSDAGLRVRTAEPVEQSESLWLFLLDFERSEYHEVMPDRWSIVSCLPWSTGYVCEIAVDDASWRHEVRRALGEWASYIRLKQEGDDNALAAILTGCPDDDAASETFFIQRRKWLENPVGFDLPGDWTLAFSLDEPHKCACFAEEGAAAYQVALLEQSGLAGHRALQRQAGRVYIGNQHCAQLFPEKSLLHAAIHRAEGENLPVTVALPPMREERLSWAEEMLHSLRDTVVDEVIVNDFGLLELIGGWNGLELVLGVHLNRRRKDPRMLWKKGLAGREGLLQENCLNDAHYQKWLEERGVRRYEYEAFGTPVVAPGLHSLHLPFYQTNTSTDCPLAARCEGGDPGRPRAATGCPMWCRDHALIYPDWLGLVGRYNALFGVNQTILREPSELRRWLDAGVDRLVLELL